VARWVKWREDEYELLIDLYSEEGPSPSERSIEELRERLRERGRRYTARANEKSFRSPSSIRAQLYRLSLIARNDPRAEEATPLLMRLVWSRHRAGTRRAAGLLETPLLDKQLVGSRWEGKRAREDLTQFLFDLERLLDDFAGRAPKLMDSTTAENFRAAWKALRRERNFARAVEALEDPEVEDELAFYGLVGPPLKLKIEGFSRSLKRMAGKWTWKRVKPVLKWANVLLGSLGQVATLGMIDPIREMKEAGEAGAEESYESGT
jgi:hypothetical protein